VVDSALTRSGRKPVGAPSSQPPSLRTRAAAAGVQFSTSNSDIPEFEVKGSPAEDEDSEDSHQPADDDDRV
jgi:hypothetical protein